MRPNLLLITTDQQRGDCTGYDGHPCLRTPHLDMLAQDACVFSQAYVDCPVCIPARTTLVTGIESHHYGSPNFNPSFRVERERDQFLGSILTRAGYQTCLIGKSHWHTEPDFNGGFEQFFRWQRRERELASRAISQASPGIGVNELSPALSTLPPEYTSTGWAVGEGIQFLEDRDRSRPFALWISLIDPHPPNVVQEPYYSMYDGDAIPEPVHPAWSCEGRAPYAIRALQAGNAHASPTAASIRKSRGVYYGMISHVDHQLGRLFGTLMRHGLWDDTAIVFSSDHGEQLFDHGTCFKGNFLDPSARVPMLLRLPPTMGGKRGSSSSSLAQWADLLPTLCGIAEAPCPDDIDGQSLLPIATGGKDSVRECLHGQIGHQHMFHNGRYKYLYFTEDGAELVFDKEGDTLDQIDLSESDPELTARLRRDFIEHLKEEHHPHLSPDGELLNQGKTFRPEEHTNSLGWMGLTPLQ